MGANSRRPIRWRWAEAPASGGAAAPAENFDQVYAAADPAKGEKVFAKCKACHKIDGTNGTGPHLNGVVGRPIASVPGFGYSDALKALGGNWEPARMQQFIHSPKGYAPGTKMGFAGLPKIEDRARRHRVPGDAKVVTTAFSHANAT